LHHPRLVIAAADDAQFLPALMQYFSVVGGPLKQKAKEAMFRSRFITADEAWRLGFVNHVVPRAQLEAETMALAREIADNDPCTLRMVKWATNAAQDAMGFSDAMRNAHSHYMVHGLDSYLKDSLERLPESDARRSAGAQGKVTRLIWVTPIP